MHVVSPKSRFRTVTLLSALSDWSRLVPLPRLTPLVLFMLRSSVVTGQRTFDCEALRTVLIRGVEKIASPCGSALILGYSYSQSCERKTHHTRAKTEVPGLEWSKKMMMRGLRQFQLQHQCCQELLKKYFLGAGDFAQ